MKRIPKRRLLLSIRAAQAASLPRRKARPLGFSLACLASGLAVAAVLVSGVDRAGGTTYFWDVDGATGGFSTVVGAWDGTNSFWNDSATGGAGTLIAATASTDDLIIAQATTNTGSITVSGTQNASSITFAPNVGPTTTITGGAIVIGGTGTSSGIFQQSTGANIVATNLTLNSAVTAFNYGSSGTGLLTISGTTTGSATTGVTQLITIGSSNTGGITLSGIIADGVAGGKVGLSINSTGTGVTNINAANTFTGNTVIRAGSVQFNNATSLGAGTVRLGNTSGSANVTLTSNAAVTAAQPITLEAGNTGIMTIRSIGTVAAVFSGGVNLNGHDLVFSKGGTTGSLTESGPITGAGNVTLTNVTGVTTGTIVLSGSVNHAGTITNAGTFGTGASSISGNIGANVTGITQMSTTNALTLSSTTANALTGPIAIKAGTLNANAGAAVAVLGSGALALGDTTGAANATLNFGSAFGTTEVNSITVVAGTTGTLTISNTSANSRTLNGTVTLNNAGGLTISSTAAGSITFAAAVSGAGGPVTINNTSTGVTLFNVANVINGLNVNAGVARTLVATGFGTGTINLGNTSGTAIATLQSSGSVNIANPINVRAGSTGVKTLQNSGNVTPNFSGVITFGDNLSVVNSGTGTTMQISGTSNLNGKVLTLSSTSSGTLQIQGLLSGAGSIVTTGAGTGNITFTQQHTYSGGITIGSTGSSTVPTVSSTPTSGVLTSGPFGTGTITFNGGVMRPTTAADITLGNTVSAAGNMTFNTVTAEKSLTFTGATTLTGNRVFTTNIGTTVTGKAVIFSGGIGDSGGAFGVTQSGTGNLVLSGTNTYTGTTAATSGALLVSGTVATNSGLNITPSGAAGAVVSFVNNAANTPTSFGTVTLGSAAGPSIIGLDLGTASDIINTAAAATANNSIAFAINGAAGFGVGSYNLITALSGLTATGATYSISRAPGGFTYGFTNTDAQVQLNVAAVAGASSLYWRGNINGSWAAFSGGTTNWSTDAAGLTPANYTPGVNQTAIFSAANATGPAITTTLDADFSVVAIQFTSAPTGVTAVTVNPGLTAGGTASVLTITPVAATDGISVAANAGAITIAAPIVLGATQTWNVDGTGTSSLAVSGAITGPAGSTLNITGGPGTGVVSFSAAAALNTYSGPTVVSAGGILQGTVAANLSANSAMTVNGTGILRLNGIANTVPSLAGNGILENNSAATAVALTINNAGTTDFGGTIRNGAAAFLNIVKSGIGIQTFSGTYSYTGTTAVNAGILRYSGADTAAAANTITVNTGGTLQFGASNPLSAIRTVALAGTGTFDLNGFSGIVGGQTSTATNVISNNSASTDASSATTVGTPSGASVFVDALTIATQAQTVAALVQDGATRKTQLVVNNNLTSTLITTNTANTFSGGLVLANNVSGTRLSIATALTGTPFGSGPIIIGQTNTDRAGIFFSTVPNALSNPIVFNTSLGNDRFGIRNDAQAITLSGLITANSDAVFSSNNATASNTTVTNKITGPGGLAIDLSQTSTASTLHTVTLNTAANANDYAGDTVIGRVNGTPAQNWAATLALGGADQIPNGAGKGNVTVNDNTATRTGTLNLNGFNETINGLNGNGTVDAGTTGTPAPTLTVGDNNASGNFTGVLKNTLGSLTLTKTGTGTQTLGGTNTFSGAVNVNGGGALAFSSGANLGDASATNVINLAGNASALSYTGAGAVSLGATRVVTLTGGGTLQATSGTGVLTVDGGINPASTGNLSKTGSGTVVIPGTTGWDTGAGTVTVSDGRLTAGFGTGGVSAITVGGTGNMSFVNSTIEALTLGSTAGALTLGSGARLGFELNGTTNDSVIVGAGVGGLAVATGTIVLDFFNFGAGVSAATYNLLASANGGLTAGGVTYVLGTAPNGFNYTINQTNTLVSLTASAFTPIYWRGGQNLSWATLGAASANWTSDAGGLTDSTHIPLATETVIFSATGAPTVANTINTTLDGAVTVDSVQFINVPAGILGVTVAAGTGGTLTLAPQSTSGGIKILTGAGNATITAPLTLATTLAPSQTWEVVDGTSVLDVSGNATFTAGMSKTGAGTLTLSGTNAGAGSINLTAGTLNINSTTALGTGIFTIGAGATIDNSTAGSIALANSNVVRVTGDFTFTGTQGLNLGTGAVTLTQNSTITTTANTLTSGGAVGETGGARSLAKAGAGTLVLNGNNSYTGTTTVNAGTLTLGGSNTFAGLVTLNAGTLNLNNSNVGAGGVTMAAGTLNLANAGALGTGPLTIGGGALDNTSGGALTLSTGNPQVWNGSFTFTGTNDLNMGTGAVTLGTMPTVTVTANTLTVAGNISGIGVGVIKTGAGTLNLSGTNGYTGLTSNTGANSILNMSGTFNNQGGIAVGTGGVINLTGSSTGNGTVGVNNGTMNVTGMLTSAGAINLGNGSNFARLNVQSGGAITGATAITSPAFTIGTNNTSPKARVTLVTGGAITGNTFNFGASATAAGAFYQAGGTLTQSLVAGTGNFQLGSVGLGYGYYGISGGAASASEVGLGGNGGGNGMMEVSGGTFTINKNGGSQGFFIMNRSNTASQASVLNVSGGILDVSLADGGLQTNQGTGDTQSSIINISGGSFLGTGRTLLLNRNNASATEVNSSTSILNLNGGVTTLAAITTQNITAAATNLVQVNFNGGTLIASATGGTLIGALANGAGYLATSGAYIYGGGAVIDTNGLASNIIAVPLLAPTGVGVSGITLTTGGTGYVSAPIVRLTGGTGTGATALATLTDDGSGNGTFAISGFTITNPGTGYTAGDVLTATLLENTGLRTTAATVGAVTLNAGNTSGALTKNSAGTLILSGANTYAGTTTINAGTLQLGSAGGTGTLNPASNIVDNGTFSISRTGTITQGTDFGTISGPGSFTNISTGTTILTATNTYQGGTSNTSTGVLQIGNGGTTGTIGIGAVTNAGTLTFNRTDTYTLDATNLVSGAGATVLANAGAVVAVVDNQFNTTGALTFGSSNASTIASTLDLTGGNSTFGGLVVQTNTVNANTIALGSKTLTINGNVNVGNTTAVTGQQTHLTVTGATGTLAVNLGAAGTFRTGTFTGGTNIVGISVVNLSGLANFTVTGGATSAFTVAQQGDNSATGVVSMRLANTANSIQAQTLTIGNGASNPQQSLRLGNGTGTTNVFNVDTLNMGIGGRDSALFSFDTGTGAANGTVSISNRTNTGATVFNMGTGGATTGAVMNNVFDVTGHTATLNFAAATVGTQTARAGGGANTFSFDKGSLTFASITASTRSVAGTMASTFNFGSAGSTLADTVNITNGILQLGLASTIATAIANGTVHIVGGTVNIGATAGTSISMASATFAGATANGTVNLTGGTTTLSGDILRAGGVGTANATVILDGATAVLDMGGKNIGSGASLVTFDVRQGTLKNLNEFNGGANLVKTTPGTLTLTGSNAYTGATNIQAGTVNADTLAAAAAPQSLGANNTVNLGVAATSSGTLNYTGAAGTLDKNINALGNGTDTVRNSGTGLLTLSGTLDKSGTTLILDGGANGIAVTGQITGVNPNSDLTATNGTTTLSNNNPYNGATTVTSTGTLVVATGGSLSGTTGVTVASGGQFVLNNNVNNIVNATAPAPLALAGGSVAMGPAVSVDSTKTQTFATLTLSGAAIVDFGTGAQGNALVFAQNASFAAGTLSIWNWSQGSYVIGTNDGGSLNDTQDRFLFDGVGSGLAPDRLANIQFFSDAGVTPIGFGAAEVNFGAQFEIVPVPEPATATLLGSVALCALIGYRSRRRVA